MPRRRTRYDRFRSLALAVVLAVLPLSARGELPLRVTTLAPSLDGAVGGVAVDALGFVYVADFGEKVWKVSPWGDVEVLADGLYMASGNTVDHAGFLMQSSFQSDRLMRIGRDGAVEVWATGLSGPVGVVEGEPGTFYVCNCKSNSIARIGTDREPAEFAKSELLNCPNGITKDGEGRLWVVNFADGRLLRIGSDGEVSPFAVIPGGGNGHVVAVGADLFVTGFRANRVFRVTPDGSVTLAAGSGAFGEDDGAGDTASFSTPNGIAYDATRDLLYVNDYQVPWPARFEGRTRPVSALRRLAFPTLREIADDAFASGSRAEAKARLRAQIERRPGRPYPPILNFLGYGFLRSGDVGAAVGVFELATELYPNVANVWDSLGEAELAAGDRDAAVRHYRRSLELDPGNANARAKLEELGAATPER